MLIWVSIVTLESRDLIFENSAIPSTLPFKIKDASMKLKIILALSIWMFIHDIGFATTYYVATNGSDASNGLSISTPFRSIQHASSLVNPGDSVLVRGGVYRERLTISRSGNANFRIFFKNYKGEMPVIDGSQVFTWILDAGQVYRTTVSYSVNPVVVDDTLIKKARDRQNMQPGTFYQSEEILYVWCPGGGSPSAHTVGIIKKFNGWSRFNEPSQVEINGRYVNFDGFIIRHSFGHGIEVLGDHVRVKNCVTKLCVLNGVIMVNVDSGEITGCSVNENCLMNWPRGGRSAGWPGALGYVSGSNGLIAGNTVYRNHGEGIVTNGSKDLAGTINLEIIGNKVYDNWSANIYIDHGSNIIVDGNLIYVTSKAPQPALDKSSPSGILNAEEGSYGNPNGLHDNIIINNIVIGCHEGFGFWFDENGNAAAGLKNYLVANNTLVNNLYHGIWVDKGNHAGSIFRNNIIYQDRGSLFNMLDPNNTLFDHNCWYQTTGGRVFLWNGTSYDYSDWQAAANQGFGSVWGNPDFIAGIGFKAENYELSSSSICREAGIDIPEVKTDYWDTIRPQAAAFDIGANEFVIKP